MKRGKRGHDASGNRTVHTRAKRRRAVQLPTHVAALYESRLQQMNTSTARPGRDEIFGTSADRERALKALCSASMSRKKATKSPQEQNDVRPEQPVPAQDSICDPVPDSAEPEDHENGGTQCIPDTTTPVVEMEETARLRPSIPSLVSGHNADISTDNIERTQTNPTEYNTGDEGKDEYDLVREKRTKEMGEQGLVSESSDDDDDDVAAVDPGGETDIEPLDEGITIQTLEGESIVCESPSEALQQGEQVILPSPDLKLMRRRMKLMVKWEQMVSCVCMSGSVRFT